MRTDATQVLVGNRANSIRFPIIQNSKQYTSYSVIPLQVMRHIYQCITPNVDFHLYADRPGHYFKWMHLSSLQRIYNGFFRHK